jgi:hypothetical protein
MTDPMVTQKPTKNVSNSSPPIKTLFFLPRYLDKRSLADGTNLSAAVFFLFADTFFFKKLN